jgi:cell division septal protein FtsQ
MQKITTIFNWKIYILTIYILLVVFLMYRVVLNNSDKFLIDIESDIDIKNLSSLPKYIYDLNLSQLRETILSFNGIKSVDIKVILPNKVYIKTQKRKPIAVWWNYEKFFLVDEYGVIISDNVSEKDKRDYTFIVGLGAIDNLKAITDGLISSNYNGKIVSMRFVGKRRWDIVLGDGTLIKLPEKNEKIAIKLLDELLHSKVKLIEAGHIVDMRLAPKKVFLKRHSNVKK